MDLKYSGILFFVIVVSETITGLALESSSIPSLPHTGNVSVVVAPSESPKPSEKITTTESVTIITPKSDENVPKTISNVISTTKEPSKKIVESVTNAPVAVLTSLSDPEKGHWILYNNKTKMVCIIADMAIQLNITYPGKDKLPKNTVINVPKNANQTGECDSDSPTQTLALKWDPGHTIQINFKSNKTAKNFYISSITLSVNATVFNGALENSTVWQFVNNSVEFVTPLEMSYKCNKVQNLILEKGDSTGFRAVLSMKETQLEAFMNNTKAEFGAVQDCDVFDTPDIVPIAVGCALAILVLVVLSAYLIGRRRSQNRGYLSM